MTRRLARFALAAALAAGATTVAGCGNTEDVVTEAKTEGIYLDLAGLKYQVQTSRYINASDVEDRTYLQGLPTGTSQPSGDETWFGVWMRVSNETSEAHPMADNYEIHDTENNVYRPVPLDANVNSFAYEATDLAPRTIIPLASSIPASGPIGGALLLFKVKTSSLQNRPLELRFNMGGSGQTDVVDLDV
jgi:hypothetical protein